jgi:hypothetical protein
MKTEKLNALAAQAGFDVERLRAPYPGGFPREDMLALESFAELIVKECAKRSEELGQPELGKGLMKHFGVEE